MQDNPLAGDINQGVGSAKVDTDVTGELKPNDAWYEGTVFDGKDMVGFIRLERSGDYVLSNFKTSSDAAWSDDIKARQLEAVKVPDCSLE